MGRANVRSYLCTGSLEGQKGKTLTAPDAHTAVLSRTRQIPIRQHTQIVDEASVAGEDAPQLAVKRPDADRAVVRGRGELVVRQEGERADDVR